MDTVIAALEAAAINQYEEQPVHYRYARVGDEIYIDLGNDKWDAVRITAEGWAVVANPKVLVMNAAAGLIIGTAAVGASGLLAVAFYTALAGSTVIAPVLAYVVAGERVDPQLERIRHWMQREQAALTAIILVVVGVMLAYTGIRAL